MKSSVIRIDLFVKISNLTVYATILFLTPQLQIHPEDNNYRLSMLCKGLAIKNKYFTYNKGVVKQLIQ